MPNCSECAKTLENINVKCAKCDKYYHSNCIGGYRTGDLKNFKFICKNCCNFDLPTSSEEEKSESDDDIIILEPEEPEKPVQAQTKPVIDVKMPVQATQKPTLEPKMPVLEAEEKPVESKLHQTPKPSPELSSMPVPGKTSENLPVKPVLQAQEDSSDCDTDTETIPESMPEPVEDLESECLPKKHYFLKPRQTENISEKSEKAAEKPEETISNSLLDQNPDFSDESSDFSDESIPDFDFFEEEPKSPEKSPNKSPKETPKKLPKKKSKCDDDKCEALVCFGPDKDEIHWIQCDNCEKWFHMDCIGMKPGQIPDEQVWKCKRCRKIITNPIDLMKKSPKSPVKSSEILARPSKPKLESSSKVKSREIETPKIPPETKSPENSREIISPVKSCENLAIMKSWKITSPPLKSREIDSPLVRLVSKSGNSSKSNKIMKSSQISSPVKSSENSKVANYEAEIRKGDWPIDCIKCEKPWGNLKRFKLHMIDHWSFDNFLCPICETYTNRYRPHFLEHLQFHIDGKSKIYNERKKLLISKNISLASPEEMNMYNKVKLHKCTLSNDSSKDFVSEVICKPGKPAVLKQRKLW